MNYETYRYIFIGAAIGASFMLALTILLFFKLKISKAIASLSSGAGHKFPRSDKVKQTAAVEALPQRFKTTTRLKETVILNSSQLQHEPPFEVEVDITFIHTSEEI